MGKFVINQEEFTKRHIKLNKKDKKRLYSSKILQKRQWQKAFRYAKHYKTIAKNRHLMKGRKRLKTCKRLQKYHKIVGIL